MSWRPPWIASRGRSREWAPLARRGTIEHTFLTTDRARRERPDPAPLTAHRTRPAAPSTECPQPIHRPGYRLVADSRSGLDMVVANGGPPLDVVFWGLDCDGTAGVTSDGRTARRMGRQTAGTDRGRTVETARDRIGNGSRPGASQLSPIRTHKPVVAAEENPARAAGALTPPRRPPRTPPTATPPRPQQSVPTEKWRTGRGARNESSCRWRDPSHG